MTSYTDLKARLREALDVRLSLNEKIIPVGEAEVKRILAAIEELEQRSAAPAPAAEPCPFGCVTQEEHDKHYAAPQPAQADEALTCSDAREERVGCYRAVRAENRADEARELLRESMNQHIYDEGPPDLIERIRAFLKDRT